MLSWFAKRKTDPKRVLDQVLGSFELPSFPVVVTEAMRQLRDPELSLSDIATGLMRDPKVTVRILNLANSPAYSLRHPVRNVQHAVSLLGRSEVEALLLSVAVRGVMPKTPRWFDDARFWQASARRAASARALAKKLHPSTANEAFTAALLQDMAVPLLAKARKEYRAVRDAWAGGDDPLGELERDRLGFDHATIAAAMSERWGFPEKLIVAIGGHHEQSDDIPPSVRIVAELEEIDAEEDDLDVLVSVAHDDYGLQEDDAETLLEAAFAEADQVASALTG